MHPIYHDKFIKAIHAKTKIKLTFFSTEDNSNLIRLCAPMDFAPFARAKDQSVHYYHLWDYESDKRVHNLAVLTQRVVHMEFTDKLFEPVGFVTWKCKWIIKRDWGEHS